MYEVFLDLEKSCKAILNSQMFYPVEIVKKKKI